MTLITSTRMYDVAPSARSAWHDLLSAAHRAAGLDIRFVEHGWPTPIGELWDQPGLCGVFMCGWPFINAMRQGRRFLPVASVVPDFPAYEGLPRYRSEFLVRDDVNGSSLADAVGMRYGWMVRDSQSGWNAPRSVLAMLPGRQGNPSKPLFSSSSGPYGNPRGLLRALQENEIDVTAIDGWYLDLLRVQDPAALAGLRTLAYTPWTPNPLLVSGPDVDPDVAARLTDVLTSMHEREAFASLLQQARVARFVRTDGDSYEALIEMERRAIAEGYGEIG